MIIYTNGQCPLFAVLEKSRSSEPMLVKEFCAENFTNIPAAITKDANRIELCDHLSVGGTTVSYGIMEHSIQYCHAWNVPVMVMIRPHGGNFVYDETEVKIMLSDIEAAKKIGADGVVFGCLTDQNKLDAPSLRLLIEASGDLDVTFHMAFDYLDKEEQYKAIDWLAEHKVKRILTHGGPMKQSIEDHFAQLRALINYANQKVIILPGGGISRQNIDHVAEQLNVHEVHGTHIV